jgi:hypothetical protein
MGFNGRFGPGHPQDQDDGTVRHTAKRPTTKKANKLQTGFDQPMLCGMYIDKRLAGIQAVQTLSRLNRAFPGKDITYVLDFVNDTEEVLAASKTYYTTAELSAATAPNLVFNRRAKLDAAGYYDDFEVDRVVEAELKGAKQSELVAAVAPVEDRPEFPDRAKRHARHFTQPRRFMGEPAGPGRVTFPLRHQVFLLSHELQGVDF